MSNVSLLMVTAPSLSLLLVGVALLVVSARRGSADRTRLILLRGMVWSFGAVLLAYLGAEAVLLAQNNFHGFTSATFLPIVVFGSSAAAASCHIRNLKRRAAAISRSPRGSR